MLPLPANNDIEKLTAADLKKLMDEAEKLDKARRDPVLNIEARTKKDSELQSKAQEIKSLERDINEFQQRRQGQLQQEQMQERKGIYDEIMAIVAQHSDVWVTTREEMAKYVLSQTPA